MKQLQNEPSRRHFLRHSAALATGLALAPARLRSSFGAASDRAINIGSRRELFVDRYLIHELLGGAVQSLHHPVPREVALRHDQSWEGTGSGYHNVFQDGDLYRMYYKAWNLGVSPGKLETSELFCCYAESDDGIRWRRPKLGLHSHAGSTQNNIVMASGKLGPLNLDAGHVAVFQDENPAAAADARYKAIARSREPNGLLPFKSSDGLDWSPMTSTPILHNRGAFDSQNLAFWDPNIGKYRAYWRIFTEGVTRDGIWKPAGIRAIRTATSPDLITWGPHTDLTYEDSPPEQLYTNQIKPYHRAPHLLIGFPTRYIDRGWSASMRSLPAVEQREMRASVTPRYGTALTDALFMASRDGTHFHRWKEAFLRPGSERLDSWHYGQQYIAWHVVETKSALAGAANELSLYASESYWHGKGSAVRRYTLRLDGFVSVKAPAGEGGEFITKTLTFDGSSLHVNFASSAAGGIRVELQNGDGSPIKGYSLADSQELFGDSVDRVVRWQGGTDVSGLRGKPLRIRVALRDADLYSFQFVQ